MTEKGQEWLGDWRLKHDTRVRMGISAFTISAGAIVAVRHLEPANNKVLVEVGPRDMDWMHESWLADHCERVD